MIEALAHLGFLTKKAQDEVHIPDTTSEHVRRSDSSLHSAPEQHHSLVASSSSSYSSAVVSSLSGGGRRSQKDGNDDDDVTSSSDRRGNNPAAEFPDHTPMRSCPFLDAGATFELPLEWVKCGALFPYSCLRDTSVDLLGLSRMLYSIRRRVWGRGWLPPTSPTGETLHTFMASQLLVLCNTGVYDKSVDQTSEVHYEGKAAVHHCGGSSFSFYAEARAVDTANHNHCFIGFNLIALVSIDGKTRRPTKLPDERRQRLLVAISEAKSQERVNSLGATPLGKLPDTKVVLAVASADHQHHHQHHHHETYEYRTTIRPYDDFDFNQHVNQGVYIKWMVDGVISMCAHADAARIRKMEENRQQSSSSNSSSKSEKQDEQKHKDNNNVTTVDDDDNNNDSDDTAEERMKLFSSPPPSASTGDREAARQHSKRFLRGTVRGVRIDYVEEIRPREGTVLVLLHTGKTVDEHARHAFGAGLLHKIAPTRGLSQQRLAYFTISLGDTVSCRGFVVFDLLLEP